MSKLKPKSATSIISLYTDLDDENNSDIDSWSLVEKLTKIYTEAGFKTVFRDNCNKICEHTRYIKRKKEWMSINCLMLWREVRNLGKKLQKHQIIVIYFMHFHRLKNNFKRRASN